MIGQVMLKDIADSKRLNANIHAVPAAVGTPNRGRKKHPDIANVSATVISSLFWPERGAGEDAEVKMHPKVRATYLASPAVDSS